MIYSVALLIAVLCGFTFWAPYAMEQSRQTVVQSRWFMGLCLGIIMVWSAIFLTSNSQMVAFPWLSALLLLSVVDAHHQSVRVVDLFIMSLFVLPLLHFGSIFHVVALCAVFFVLLMLVKISLKKIYKQNALGGADIWVILTILAGFGGRPAIVALYAGIILSAIIGASALLLKIKSRTSPLPFIPFLTAGCLFSLFFRTKL